MSEVMTPVPRDDPMMIAWEKYRMTDEYQNTAQWAMKGIHVHGSL